MKELGLSPIASSLRNAVLDRADNERAVETANIIIERMLEMFSDRDDSVATSLVARALVARSMVSVAAQWVRDLNTERATLPDCFAAMTSLVDDPPAWVDSNCYKVEPQ